VLQRGYLHCSPTVDEKLSFIIKMGSKRETIQEKIDKEIAKKKPNTSTLKKLQQQQSALPNTALKSPVDSMVLNLLQLHEIAAFHIGDDTLNAWFSLVDGALRATNEEMKWGWISASFGSLYFRAAEGGFVRNTLRDMVHRSPWETTDRILLPLVYPLPSDDVSHYASHIILVEVFLKQGTIVVLNSNPDILVSDNEVSSPTIASKIVLISIVVLVNG